MMCWCRTINARAVGCMVLMHGMLPSSAAWHHALASSRHASHLCKLGGILQARQTQVRQQLLGHAVSGDGELLWGVEAHAVQDLMLALPEPVRCHK